MVIGELDLLIAVKLLLFVFIADAVYMFNYSMYRMAEDFEEHSTRALQNPEKHMSNPVNAFLAVKRFTSDWDYIVQTYIRNNITEGLFSILLRVYNCVKVIIFSARCNIYILRLCYDVTFCLSVCDGSALAQYS